MHFFNEFSETKSSAFLKKIVANQGAIEMILFKRTWMSLNCTPKTMRVIREIQENLLCVGRRKDLLTKKKGVDVLAQQGGVAFEYKAQSAAAKKVSAEINTRNDLAVNILLNIIHTQRGLITHEQKWEERKTVRTRTDEITVGTKHLRSEE